MSKNALVRELKFAAIRYTKLSVYFFIGLCLLSVAPDFLGKEFIVNLAPIWLAGLIISLLFYFFIIDCRSVTFLVGVLVCSIFIFWVINRVFHYYPIHSEVKTTCAQKISVIYANVLTKNQNKEKLNNFIKQLNPDIVALVETDQAWIDSVQLNNNFLYFESKPLNNNFGISLFSKYKIVGPTTLKLDHHLPPVVHTFVDIGSESRRIQMVVFHTFPPQLTSGLNINPQILDKLSSLVRKSSEPVIMAGDLNATSFSNYYWKWINSFNVVDTMSGFGIFRTWHAQSNFFRLTLDYVFTSKSIKTKSWTRLDDIGSDHFPIFAELCLEG
jgi:endonuclease/exonuclease/phosphatase (EEP) superfamily protein YafD